MENFKSLSNDGVTEKCFETFWEKIKNPFSNFLPKSFLMEELSISQKQAVIKLIEKTNRDKR